MLWLSLAKTSSDSLRSTEIRQSVHRPKTPSLVGDRATGIVRPSALHGHTGVAREDGERAGWRLSWTCDACSMVVRTAGAGLRRLADVAMMQATDFGNLHDPGRLGELDGPDVRRILVEREMRASPVIVGEVAGQDAAQVAFAENQNVIQTLAADRADEPLREGFCHGLCGAVRTSSIRMPFTRWRNCSP